MSGAKFFFWPAKLPSNSNHVWTLNLVRYSRMKSSLTIYTWSVWLHCQQKPQPNLKSCCSGQESSIKWLFITVKIWRDYIFSSADTNITTAQPIKVSCGNDDIMSFYQQSGLDSMVRETGVLTPTGKSFVTVKEQQSSTTQVTKGTLKIELTETKWPSVRETEAVSKYYVHLCEKDCEINFSIDLMDSGLWLSWMLNFKLMP